MKKKEKQGALEKKNKKDKDKDATPVTKDVTINTTYGQRKKKQPTGDTSNVTCYNCNKKHYYANKYFKPLKN